MIGLYDNSLSIDLKSDVARYVKLLEVSSLGNIDFYTNLRENFINPSNRLIHVLGLTITRFSHRT